MLIFGWKLPKLIDYSYYYLTNRKNGKYHAIKKSDNNTFPLTCLES